MSDVAIAEKHFPRLGTVRIKANDEGVFALDITDERAHELAPPSRFTPWFDEIEAYFHGSTGAFTIPLAVEGTAFQRRVWDALRAIPYGETRSYASLAASLGIHNGARAVAGACAQNRVALVIPCHRIVQTNGGLAGFRWGVERKRWLLTHEAAHTNALSQLEWRK